jgi:precorrin-6A/cobalt-precorrin-6A reductase
VTVLVLGGSTEGFALAEQRPDAILSLAGRVATPRTIPGRTRIGGFGGVDGLADALRDIDAVVDATHPFAAQMGRNAKQACDRTSTPLLRLERPGFTGDFTWVGDVHEAAAHARGRAFLALGRQELAAFADVDAHCVIRSITPPDPPLPRHHELVLARGPFTLEDEREALRTIDVLITRDAGGDRAKLDAAGERGIEVVMIRRPPRPDVPAVATVDDALAWLRTRAGDPADPAGSST